MENEEYYTTNNVAGIIKIISIIELIIFVIVCIVCSQYLEIYTIILIIAGLIASVFVYAIGELIGIMHDIRTNTEHIRDFIESEKK